jgi:hypothetical protein
MVGGRLDAVQKKNEETSRVRGAHRHYRPSSRPALGLSAVITECAPLGWGESTWPWVACPAW